MTDYHEPVEELSPQDRDHIRALTSLKEEIDAVNWYHQRVAVAADPELKKVLAHNRDEEIEHACMALEWLRRNMPSWDEKLRIYLFSEGDLTLVEAQAEVRENVSELGGQAKPQPAAPRADLGIGSLKR